MFPRLLTEREARFLWNTRARFSPLWLLRVTGNCFWFLDRPPVSKGLQTDILSKSPSARRFVLVVRRIAPLLEIYFFTDSVCGFFAIRSIRVDCWIWNFFNRQILEIPTDRHMKVGEKTVWFWKRLRVQSKVLVNWDLWEVGIGFLRGATWFRWSQARRFDQRRTIAKFGDPSGEHTVKHYCFIDIDSAHFHCSRCHRFPVLTTGAFYRQKLAQVKTATIPQLLLRPLHHDLKKMQHVKVCMGFLLLKLEPNQRRCAIASPPPPPFLCHHPW